MARSLTAMTWPQVAAAVEAGATTVILPLGATEQHGPHLPLGTDTIRAEALAARVAGLLPGILVAPALPVGCSDEHAGFAGLLSLDAATLAAVVVDCARRMAAWGVRRLVVLSAHGGNGRALALVAERLRRELPELDVRLPGDLAGPGDAALAVAAADAVPPEAVGIHAGEGETSELLCLCPELVHMANAAAGYCGDMAAIIPALERHGLRPVAPNGVLGDPACADAARGARYLDACAAALALELAAR